MNPELPLDQKIEDAITFAFRTLEVLIDMRRERIGDVFDAELHGILLSRRALLPYSRQQDTPEENERMETLATELTSYPDEDIAK